MSDKLSKEDIELIARRVFEMMQESALSGSTSELVSVREASVMLNLSIPTIYSMINKGRIRSVKFGSRASRVYRKDIEELLNGGGVA